MSEKTVDTAAEAAPTLVEEAGTGSVAEATESLLKMLDADDAPPATEEETPLEETEDSQPEEEEESADEEEVSDSADEYDEEYEPEDIAEVEGDDADVYAVKVDGQDVEVSLNELLAGYSRQSDYTRKTQELATERKQLEEATNQYMEEIQQNSAVREQYIQATGQFIAQAHSNLEQYTKIDWKALKEDDPIEYVTKRDEFREYQGRIQHAQRLQQQAAAEAQEEQGMMLEQHVAREHELMVEKVPEWADQEKRSALAGKIKGYADTQGFTAEEIGSLSDHRSLNVLIKAMKYDALEKGGIRDKKIRNKPKLVKSGTSRTKDAANKKKRNAQINRLKSTGDTKDAAALLEDLI